MKFFIYALLFISFSCKNDKKILRKNYITIHGSSDDSSFIKHLNIINYSYFNSTNHKFKAKNVEINSLNLKLKKIYKPQLMELMAFGKDVFHNTKIFVTPGDSIELKVKKGRLVFKGENAAQYNFYLQLDSTNSQWSKISFKNYKGIEKYKKECKLLYNYRKTFLKAYIFKHKNVSKEFVEKVKADLKHEYLYNLISPRKYQGYNNTNINSSDLSKVIYDSNKNEDEFFDLKNYLDNPKIRDFNRPELLTNDSFKQSLIPFVRQYFIQNEEEPFTIKAFNTELEFIQKNFDIDIVKYAEGKMITDYFEKGLGKDKISKAFLKNKIKEYKKLKISPTYLEAVSEVEADLNAIKTTDLKGLKEKFITLQNDTLTLDSILKTSKIKIICFWASWCEPCIRDIIASKEIKVNLRERYNVEFIYLSLDKNTKKWLKKSAFLSTYLENVKQYKILNLKKSQILKSFQMDIKNGIMIPRYIVLGEKNEIISNNAPKISNKKELEKIISEIE